MLTSTFRCPGVGPSRERELWEKGIHTWDQLPENGVILSPRLDGRLREAVAHRRRLLSEGRIEEIAREMGAGEHWRLWPHLRDGACFLDIETDGFSDVVTSIAILGAEGPRAFVRGFDLDEFPQAMSRFSMVVTFNGAAFDLPILRRAFPGAAFPKIHVDLRVLLRRLGERGGLKKIEERLGLSRPDGVKGVDGYEAVLLWRRWSDGGDEGALLRLVEYNLYDAIQLRPLLEIAYGRLVRESGLPVGEGEPLFSRGDVIYDVSKYLLDLSSRIRNLRTG